MSQLNSQSRNTFVCSGCDDTFPMIEMSRIGPNNYRWCNKESCLAICDLVYSAVCKDIDDQGRKLIAHYRKIGDKESEEIAMVLYMIGKMEPMS